MTNTSIDMIETNMINIVVKKINIQRRTIGTQNPKNMIKKKGIMKKMIKMETRMINIAISMEKMISIPGKNEIKKGIRNLDIGMKIEMKIGKDRKIGGDKIK